MRTQRRSGGSGRIAVAAVISLGLLAAACSKKDDNSGDTKAPTTTVGAATTATAATTPASTSTVGSTSASATGTASAPTTAAATTTTVAAATTTSTAPAEKPVVGGSLIVSGDAEVVNPWTPVAMNCDSYCFQRALSFFDPVGALGTDQKVHGVLAESITPNADFTQWTIKVRSGIKFTDGTDVNADAVIRNLQETGTGILLTGVLTDIAKLPDPSGAKNTDGSAKMILKIDKVDDSTLTIYTGKGGDPNAPLPWPHLDTYLAAQWGLIASPKWLDEVKADPTKASQPVGSGPFVVESFTPHDTLVVTKNPDYWQKDKAGVQLPYLDKITFKVIEDAKTTQEALQGGDIDAFSTSRAQVIADFRNEADKFPMVEQSQQGETDYLLIDLAKPGPLQDARVRCALSMAIDRTELNDLTDAGILKVANGVFSPGQQGYLADNGFDTAQNIDGAKALIADYKKSTGATSIQVHLGGTADVITQQGNDLIKGYWSQIGVDTVEDVVPQDQFIVTALVGVPGFQIYSWRQHAGQFVDDQNVWWNSSSGTKDNALSLNFARINDPTVDADLNTARTDVDPAQTKANAAAEDINRTMAKQCYQIPLDWALWATPHKPNVEGLGATTLPDGAVARDGTGFPGQYWMTAMWVKPG